MAVEAFRYEAPEAALEDLRERLRRTRWPPDTGAAPWKLGFDQRYLRELCATWEASFDWRAVERYVFSFPNFRFVAGNGLRIHFIHACGVGRERLPLILIHGWLPRS